MGLNFQELDFKQTPLGELVLRRRRIPHFPGQDIFEVKLGEEFLMTSIFHESEKQLAKLALERTSGKNLDVVVGGLGLGYTAFAALEDQRINSLMVIEYLEPVIDWHKNKIVPLGAYLTNDFRCEFYHGDFFEMARDFERGFNKKTFKKKDLILLDIDHTPNDVLHVSNKRFYTEEGLRELKTHLNSGGIFGLWADSLPDREFIEHLQNIFDMAEAHTIEFKNPIKNGTSKCSVYLAFVS